MPQPGFGNQPQSKAVRVTVVGHASARWRGARNSAEAARLNEGLSIQRANNVRTVVEKILKQEIPGVTITSGSSLGPGEHPNGVQVGSYGVGSREPFTPPPVNPQENDARNRSVAVVLELVTTRYGQAGRSLTPLRVSTIGTEWYLKLLDLEGAAVGAALYYCRIAIRNPRSGKVATYKGKIMGGGIDTGTFTQSSVQKLQSDSMKGDLQHGIGDEVNFFTDKPMGFDDFSGQLIRVEKVKWGVAFIQPSILCLTFVGLRTTPALLELQHKILGLSLKLKLGLPHAFVAAGAVRLDGRNPGDSVEYDRTDSIPWANDDTQDDGLMINFPTGKAGWSDVSASQRKTLEDFVVSWARRY